MITINERYKSGKKRPVGRFIYELCCWTNKPDWEGVTTEGNIDERQKWIDENIIRIPICKKTFERLKKLSEQNF